MSKVICMKLSSGEEVITRVSTQQTLIGTNVAMPSLFQGTGVWQLPTEDLVCESVRIIAIQPMGGGKVGLSLIPWCAGDPDGTIRIRADHISAVYAPSSNLEAGYLQELSGIQIASAGSIPTGKVN